jgi:hypothetical protein
MVMTGDEAADRRLKFYGPYDLGTGFQLERLAEVLESFDPTASPTDASDVIELYNARQFLDHDLLPKTYDDERRAHCRALIPNLKFTVAKFFNGLNEDNLAIAVVSVNWQYQDDLLDLLGHFKVFDRCTADTVLSTLRESGIGLGTLLTSRRLVKSYDDAVRSLIMAAPVNAEHLIRKHLEKDVRQVVQLPPSLLISDQRSLIDAYIEGGGANPNFVELVSLAPIKKDGVVTAKTKLKAQRKHQRWTKEFFEQNTGIKTGCEVVVVDDQTEPVEASMDGLVAKFSYSRPWLEDTLDKPSILNNFLYVFQFADRRMLLTLPSFRAELGVFERFMRVTGKDFYPAGSAFQHKESAAFLQTAFYNQFLKDKGIELEGVVAWFFTDYLTAEFGAGNFRYAPSSAASTYLEKCRHLFAEMDSVLRQFALYVEDGELDLGLLAIASEQVRFNQLPSMVTGKYVYPTDDQDVRNVLHMLFSDQSGLTYIREGLQANSAAELLIEHVVAYGDFADYQKRQADYLIEQGVLTDTGLRVWFANAGQFIVLRDLHNGEAAHYYHYSPGGRAAIDDMVGRGWLMRRESLLTDAEASYFNYCLNQSQFSNGPDLRNKYVHGSNVEAADEDEHFRTYIVALKLLIALVIKINDDFCLRDEISQGVSTFHIADASADQSPLGVTGRSRSMSASGGSGWLIKVRMSSSLDALIPSSG